MICNSRVRARELFKPAGLPGLMLHLVWKLRKALDIDPFFARRPLPD